MAKQGLTVAERWSQYVAVSDGCWEWRGAKDTRGYGRFYLRGAVTAAHRVGREVFGDPIPRDLHGCHSCDNPGCVRPDHVFAGTMRDNVADMLAKGRGNFAKKLSREIADEVREFARSGAPTLAEVARRFGITKQTASDILIGRSWADGSPRIHIDGTGSRHPRSKLTEADVSEIKRLRAAGVLFRDIASRFAVSKPTARNAALGLSYRG